MIVLLAVLLLFLGAVALLFLTPERRLLRAVVFMIPFAALAVFLIPLPLPDSFSIAWQPASLFPDPLTFRANPVAVSFSVYFCILLILIEWTRPLQRASGTPSRLLCFLLTIAGILALFASNALAVALVWGWIDFLTFFAILLLSRAAEIGSKGITSSVSRSVSILAMNFLGNALVLFPVLQSLPAAHSDWSAVWSQPTSDLTLILFLTGIAIRILVLPSQLSFSRLYTSSTGVDVLLRIISPAIVLSLLAKAWPNQILAPEGNPLRTWPILIFTLMIIWAGIQWWISSSSLGRRDLFLLGVPCLAILAALQVSQPSEIFHAAGTVVILGGGALLLYRGYLVNHRWMSIPPIILAILQTGVLLSPTSVLISSFFSAINSGSDIVVLLSVGVSQILMIGALLRLSLEPVEEFSMSESFPVIFYFLGMVLALLFMFYPGWPVHQPLDPAQILIPLLFLAFAVLLVAVTKRFQRTTEDISLFLGNSVRLDWLRSGLSFLMQKFFSLVATTEDLISGEGAMLWALGFSLFLFLILRGG
jgi:hypothetical protein